MCELGREKREEKTIRGGRKERKRRRKKTNLNKDFSSLLNMELICVRLIEGVLCVYTELFVDLISDAFIS